jgi:predicted RNase H-like nuclease (RuvC/YqgF family)
VSDEDDAARRSAPREGDAGLEPQASDHAASPSRPTYEQLALDYRRRETRIAELEAEIDRVVREAERVEVHLEETLERREEELASLREDLDRRRQEAAPLHAEIADLKLQGAGLAEAQRLMVDTNVELRAANARLREQASVSTSAADAVARRYEALCAVSQTVLNILVPACHHVPFELLWDFARALGDERARGPDREPRGRERRDQLEDRAFEAAEKAGTS